VCEEQLRVRLPPEPAGPAGVVPAAGLECGVGDMHLVIGGGVLAEHKRDLIGELLRVGSRDATNPDSDVLRANDAVR
jgi:hypothetical protein